jgi:glycosyltransferase involved in cell wall biosynthesis
MNATPDSQTLPEILMLTPYLPYPLVSGGRTRTFELVKRLRRDYRITLVCFGRPEERAFDLTPLRELCDVTVIDRESSPGTIRAATLSLTSLRPIIMRLYSTPAMRETLTRLLREHIFSAIHVESFYMLQNLPPDTNKRVPVLLSEPSIEFNAWRYFSRVATPVYQRPALVIEAFKMRQFEPRSWRTVSAVGVTSPLEAEAVTRAAPDIKPILIPNGVDPDYFHPLDLPRDPDGAVYMGDYKYFPNVEAIRYFIRDIMPLIRADRPNFTLTLLGKEPPADFQALAADPQSGLRVTGLVDDTRPYLCRGSVFICPQRSGGGTRLKLLESLACGCRIVATSIGCEGLGATNGEHMLIADTPRAFADSVLHLLADPVEAEAMAKRGCDWVVATHSWDQSAILLRDTYQRLARTN